MSNPLVTSTADRTSGSGQIKQRLTNLIKKWPALYHWVSKLYWAWQPEHLAELVVGTRAREKQWARRRIAEGYWKNREHLSHRFLAERIAAFAPINSILEVGCASGPGLYLLAKRFPQARITGIDINQEAIHYGNMQFHKEGLANVELIVGRADQLGGFRDRAFDIVFTNALLIYIGPDKIREVIQEMLRITHRTLVLMELHFFQPNARDPHGLGVYQGGNWIRDYTALLKQFVPEDQIRVSKIPQDIQPARPWDESGAVIEVAM